MSCFSVIVKLTYSCPLQCKYCYNGNTSASSPALGAEQARRLIAGTMAYAKSKNFTEVEYIWMGGEPLLLPINIFEEIFQLQSQVCDGIKIVNCLQTSGVVPHNRDKLIERLALLGFRFSVSLDGPGKIHDLHRLRRKGSGTHFDAFSTYKFIKSTGAPVGAIAVLTRAACEDIDGFYNFFADNGISFSFLAPYRAGSAIINESTVPGATELTAALMRLFDRWFDADSDYVYCSTLSSMLSSLIHGMSKGCASSRNCSLRTISIDPDGNCYPCPSFPREKRYLYGNLFSENLDTLLSGESATEMLMRRSEHVPGCAVCEYREICHAGCPSSALSVNGTIHSPDGNCASYRALYSHMKERLAQKVTICKHRLPTGMKLQIESANNQA